MEVEDNGDNSGGAIDATLPSFTFGLLKIYKHHHRA